MILKRHSMLIIRCHAVQCMYEFTIIHSDICVLYFQTFVSECTCFLNSYIIIAYLRRICYRYRVFIKYCVFPQNVVIFLLQRWRLTCHCVHSLKLRGNRERPESGIYFKILEKTQYLMYLPCTSPPTLIIHSLLKALCPPNFL